MVPWQSIQGFSGSAAVGSLVFIGWILIANAFANNLVPTIKDFSETQVWAVVIAVPVLSLVYLLGLLCNGAAEALLIKSRLLPTDALDDRNILRMETTGFVASRYQQLRQEAELLAGGGLALVLLMLGASLHAWNIEGWRRFLISIAVVSSIAAIGSVALAIRRHILASRLANSFNGQQS